MSYLAIYRRYRPKSFDEVIGQQHIVSTLSNQVKNNRVGHAYLFCGSRGTGKTSCARILAKAVNCLNPINGSPCNQCEMCKTVDAGCLDVLEIDAASNNKVDEIRDLRDKIKYPPITTRYKVYIIDEVHMLTDSAFNALLKTLEEPPSHAIFILATTEPHKLPSTIMSRCIKFDFHLVDKRAVEELISRIYKEVGKEFEKEAVSLIAEAGGGSVRDSLSIADLCVSISDKVLTYHDVLNALGATNPNEIFRLCRSIVDCDLGEVFNCIDKFYEMGKSMSVLAVNLASIFRDILLIKVSGQHKQLKVPEEHIKVLSELAKITQQQQLTEIISIFSLVENEIKNSLHPRLALENAVLKVVSMQKKTDDLKKNLNEDVAEEHESVESEEIEESVESEEIAENEEIEESVEAEDEPSEEDIADMEIDEDDSELISLSQVDVAEAVVFDAGQAVNASMLWGRIVTHFRNNPVANIYQLLGSVSSISYASGTLSASFQGDDFEQINSHADKIRMVVESLSPNTRLIILKKESEQADFLKEVNKIQSIFSDIGVKIIK